MKTQRFDSVWDALEDTPQEAENLRIRSSLMIAIEQQLAGMEGTEAIKARQLDITLPRLNDLLRGKIDKFSLDALVAIASKAGLRLHIEARPL